MRRMKIEGVARILGGLESTAAISANTAATIGALWETMMPLCAAGDGISSPELFAKNGCCGAQVCGASRGALWCGQCEWGVASAGWGQFPMAHSATHCALTATNAINRRIANLIPARCILSSHASTGENLTGHMGRNSEHHDQVPDHQSAIPVSSPTNQVLFVRIDTKCA
jgi:hypothetical protein